MRLKSLTRALLVLTLAFTGLIASAQMSSAGGQYYYYKVVGVSSSLGSGGSVGSCIVTSSAGSCSVASGKTATRTISVTLGYTREGVAASLGISSSTATTITVGCSWSAKGTHYAYAYGRHYSYRIQKWYSGNGTETLVETSGVLSAFNPFSTSIYCGG